MKKSDLQRHQIIHHLTVQTAPQIVDGAIYPWEQMATQIASIVGDAGFNAMYARSLFIAQKSHPWLAGGALPLQTASRFAELKQCFEAQPAQHISAANCLMLITFTDLLASLIGEQLTNRILSSAWGHHPQDRASKESKHE